MCQHFGVAAAGRNVGEAERSHFRAQADARSSGGDHHALAEQFVLLDNYYCDGVISTDGHAWATEGVTVDYLEKSFGGWARSCVA